MVSAVYISFAAVLMSLLVSSHNLDFHDREHLQEHMQGELDLSFVSEQDLEVLYFQSHDAEGNDKLDGCELVQSLLHFHCEESHAHARHSKVFSDAELSMMIDPLLAVADKNNDGFIDFPEFVSGKYPHEF